MQPKEFWGSPEQTKEWLRIAEIKFGDKNSTTYKSTLQFLEDFKPFQKEFSSVLEVGAGNGRLIGTLSKKYPKKKCNSVDINEGLSKYIGEHYKVKTFVGEIINLPFADNSFDLVYTYQVLQHVPPEEIRLALKELTRVSKKEVWLMEGHDPELFTPNSTYKNGHMRTDAGGGTFAWQFDKLVNCYETFPSYHNGQEMGVKVYKIKI